MSALGLDPQRGVAAVKRVVRDGSAEAADFVARVVRNSPDDRIELFLRSPARRLVLDGLFFAMPRFLDRRRARDLSCTVRWNVTGGRRDDPDIYEVEFTEGRCRVKRGRSASEPRLTITLGASQLLKLATGNADPMQAYFGRHVTLAGDIMLAAKLASLFRIPGSGRSAR